MEYVYQTSHWNMCVGISAAYLQSLLQFTVNETMAALNQWINLFLCMTYLCNLTRLFVCVCVCVMSTEGKIKMNCCNISACLLRLPSYATANNCDVP